MKNLWVYFTILFLLSVSKAATASEYILIQSKTSKATPPVLPTGKDFPVILKSDLEAIKSLKGVENVFEYTYRYMEFFNREKKDTKKFFVVSTTNRLLNELTEYTVRRDKSELYLNHTSKQKLNFVENNHVSELIEKQEVYSTNPKAPKFLEKKFKFSTIENSNNEEILKFLPKSLIVKLDYELPSSQPNFDSHQQKIRFSDVPRLLVKLNKTVEIEDTKKAIQKVLYQKFKIDGPIQFELL